MRYKADITAGSLKVPESRILAELLLKQPTEQEWHKALIEDNVLQARSPSTARRLGLLLRGRLETMDDELWRMVRDGSLIVATQACLASAIKHSALLGDFLDIVIREQYKLFSPTLSPQLWERYLSGCRARDPDMPEWRESTVMRLRSSVFQMLMQGGYIENTRTLRLQTVHLSEQVKAYLHARHENYVLRCMQVRP